MESTSNHKLADDSNIAIGPSVFQARVKNRFLQLDTFFSFIIAAEGLSDTTLFAGVYPFILECNTPQGDSVENWSAAQYEDGRVFAESIAEYDAAGILTFSVDYVTMTSSRGIQLRDPLSTQAAAVYECTTFGGKKYRSNIIVLGNLLLNYYFILFYFISINNYYSSLIKNRL